MKRRDFVAQSLVLLSAGGGGAAFAQPAESTWERINRTKVLRVAAVDGGVPYYKKDLAKDEWMGCMADFYRGLAASLNVKLEITPTTWGNSVLELQSQKIDLFLGLNPTPARLEVVDFTDPVLNISFSAVCRKGLVARTWQDLDKSEMRVSVDKGSSHDAVATRLLKNAQIIRLESQSDATLALQAGRADVQILALPMALSLSSRNPNVGEVVVLTPEEKSTSHGGVRKEADSRWLKHVNQWVAAERANGNVRKTYIHALKTLGGVNEDKIPPQLTV